MSPGTATALPVHQPRPAFPCNLFCPLGTSPAPASSRDAITMMPSLIEHPISLRRLPASLPQEGIGVTGQLFLVVEELSPDPGGGGKIRQGIPESLHCEPAVIA